MCVVKVHAPPGNLEGRHACVGGGGGGGGGGKEKHPIPPLNIIASGSPLPRTPIMGHDHVSKLGCPHFRGGFNCRDTRTFSLIQGPHTCIGRLIEGVPLLIMKPDRSKHDLHREVALFPKVIKEYYGTCTGKCP